MTETVQEILDLVRRRPRCTARDVKNVLGHSAAARLSTLVLGGYLSRELVDLSSERPVARPDHPYRGPVWCYSVVDLDRGSRAYRQGAAEMAVAILFAEWVAEQDYRQWTLRELCGKGIHDRGHGPVCMWCGEEET